MNLYKYKEILENINIIVIFSIPIISLILYTLNKRKVMILENLKYINKGKLRDELNVKSNKYCGL